MKKLSRRGFISSTLSYFALGFTGLTSFAKECGKKLDEGIKKMKYVHELKAPLKGPAKNHSKLLKKALKKNPGIVSDAENALPQCKLCKYWEEKEGCYAHCKYVAKKGNSKGQKAYMNGWCQMFKPEVKADKLKKNLA